METILIFGLLIIPVAIYYIIKLGRYSRELEAELKARENIVESPEWTLDDIVQAAQYGFKYRGESQNDGKQVPVGNVLQWLMARKSLIEVPQELKDYKNESK